MSRVGVDPSSRYASSRHELWGKCDKCQLFWPQRRLVAQDDGVVRCLDNCAYPRTVMGKDLQHARLEQRIARMEASTPEPKYPAGSDMASVPSCTSINGGVLPVALSRGGAAVAVVLGGNNMTAADSISYSDPASVVDSVAPSFAVDGLSCTITVEAPGGGTPGSYDLIYEDDTTYLGVVYENRFKDVFLVR